MQSGSNARLIVIVVAVSLVIGIVGGLAGAYYYVQTVPTPEAPEVVERPPRVEIRTEGDAIQHAVERADPAVVKIVTAIAEPRTPFDHFFGPEPRVREGIGSGFVFEHEGRRLVLTNTHVVGEAQEIEVQTRDGYEYRGTVLGADPASDVALLEIEGDSDTLVPATLGDSDDLTIGEWVVAIGHPFAFDHTVTVGVVSALGPRALGPEMPARNMIQTDAAINVGNSGGPLINIEGDVIGINSMIFSPTGAAVGIGFAIPINDAMQIVHFLIERGPWLGIETRPNSEGLARHLGLHVDTGLVILSVVPNSPAAEAEIQPGDVLLSIDDQEITEPEQLREMVLQYEIDETLVLGIQRGPDRIDVEVTAGRVPEGYLR